MPTIIRDIPQNTPEWKQLRLGSIGSTAINDIAPGTDGYKNRLYRFTGEILTGIPYEDKKFRYADRGHEFEPEAREIYELINGVDVEQITLIQGDTPRTHTSTDGIIGDNGILEIKTRIPSEFIKIANGKKAPIADRRQFYWDLLVSKREWVDYVNYCPELYKAKQGGYLEKRIHRDECKSIIKELADIADEFIKDMLKLASKYGNAS